MLIDSGAGVVGYCGYLGDPAEEELLAAADRLDTRLDAFGGVFSVFRADGTGFEAATSIARVCPVYHTETADLAIAGSRALPVHLTARAARTGQTRPRPDIDLLGLQVMVRHGFYTNDETPFRDVRALPAAATLTARPGKPVRIDRRPAPEAGGRPARGRAARQGVTALAEALLEAARPLGRHGEPIMLGLTGGRDSRIMAALLHTAGVPFTARTRGFSDDPDVVLATRIAGILGVPHEVALPREDSGGRFQQVGHPLHRAHHVIRMCEGMTSAYESVNGFAPYTMTPKTSGSGGETLRGGFLYDQNDISPEGIRRRVKTIFCSADEFLTPEARERSRPHHEEWAERARADGPGVLDTLYLHYRTGRWLVGSHTATVMNWPFYHPFLDNRVVRAALELPATWRRSEEVVFRIIETLTPQLRDLPLEGKRWGFERTRPRRILNRGRWHARAALLPSGRTSGFNWRKQAVEPLLGVMREQIMDGPAELFDLVDRARIDETLTPGAQGWAMQRWHVYTLSVLLSGRWREPLPPDLPGLDIPIPSAQPR
ncbi:asparagine synthase-related protein [Actinomadura craniellae]|nr:asparagine synthase-related protein [Actinomadura craniellae]